MPPNPPVQPRAPGLADDMRQGRDERPRGPAAAAPKVCIDLAGASGALYRFERIDDLERLPAIAGNFVYVRGSGRDITVICAGADETLRRAGAQLSEAKRRYDAESVSIRRNVSRRTREQEHADIIGAYSPVMVLAGELDAPAPPVQQPD